MVPAAGVASRAGSVRIVEIPPTNQSRAAVGGLIETDAVRRRQPGRIVEWLRAPRPQQAQRATRRHQDANGRPSADEWYGIDFATDAVRHVGVLFRIRILADNSRSVRADEREVTAGSIQLEVRVQRCAWRPTVLARREHYQIAAGGEVAGRQTPFPEIAGLVGEEPAVQRHCRRAGIEQLNPIRALAIFVEHRAGVCRHEFADQDRSHCAIGIDGNPPQREDEGKYTQPHRAP